MQLGVNVHRALPLLTSRGISQAAQLLQMETQQSSFIRALQRRRQESILLSLLHLQTALQNK